MIACNYINKDYCNLILSIFKVSRIYIGKYIELEVDQSMSNVLFMHLGSREKLYYSYDLVSEISNSTSSIKNVIIAKKIDYVVLRSLNKTVWNMGGDLELFLDCKRKSNISLLEQYANNCVIFVQSVNRSFDTNAKIISLVEGNAYGGGFECVLSANFIIAEEQVKFSFPEVLFSSFPGMGAYSFLTRRIGFYLTDEIIKGGKKWKASEMQELGVVNYVSKRGEGLELVRSLIAKNSFEEPNLKRICGTVSFNELRDIVTLWVQSVLDMKEEDMRLIVKIIEKQKRATIRSLGST